MLAYKLFLEFLCGVRKDCRVARGTVFDGKQESVSPWMRAILSVAGDGGRYREGHYGVVTKVLRGNVGGLVRTLYQINSGCPTLCGISEGGKRCFNLLTLSLARSSVTQRGRKPARCGPHRFPLSETADDGAASF